MPLQFRRLASPAPAGRAGGLETQGRATVAVQARWPSAARAPFASREPRADLAQLLQLTGEGEGLEGGAACQRTRLAKDPAVSPVAWFQCLVLELWLVWDDR